MKILSLFWHSVESDLVNSEYLDGSNPTQSIFREQVEFIVNNYTPISIHDFINIREDKKLIKSYDKPPVLLGFDDGSKNVIDNALPILNEFRIPALFFVIGEIIKNPDFVPWYVEINHMLRRTERKTVFYNKSEFNLANKKGRSVLKYHLSASFKLITSEKHRQRFLTNLSNLLEIERPLANNLDNDLRFVSNEGLLNIKDTSLLTVSSHAMTHNLLANLTREEQIYELEKSNQLLSEHSQSYYPVISYPNGSFNKDTIDIAQEIYKFGFAVFLGSSYNNFYSYPRICIKHDTTKELNYMLGCFRLNLLLPIKRFLHDIGLRRID